MLVEVSRLVIILGRETHSRVAFGGEATFLSQFAFGTGCYQECQSCYPLYRVRP